MQDHTLVVRRARDREHTGRPERGTALCTTTVWVVVGHHASPQNHLSAVCGIAEFTGRKPIPDGDSGSGATVGAAPGFDHVMNVSAACDRNHRESSMRHSKDTRQGKNP